MDASKNSEIHSRIPFFFFNVKQQIREKREGLKRKQRGEGRGKEGPKAATPSGSSGWSGMPITSLAWLLHLLHVYALLFSTLTGDLEQMEAGVAQVLRDMKGG